MRWICRQSDLLKAAQNSLEFVQQKPNQSIYGNIFLRLRGDVLEIKSTSISSGFEGRISVQGSGDGMITAQGELFTQMIRNLKEEEMLEFDADEEFLRISSALSTVNYKIRYVAADSFEYREIPDDGDTLRVPRNALLEMASKAMTSVSDDASMPHLCGVHAKFTPNLMSFTSCDTRNLTYYEKQIAFPNLTEDREMIIPSKFLGDLLKIAPEDDTYLVRFSDSVFYVICENCAMWTVLTKAQYPSVSAILNREYPNSVLLPVDAFMKALRHVSIMCDNESKRVSMSFTQGKLTISSLDKEEIGSGSEQMDCDYDGDDVAFAISYAYLQNHLKALPSDSFFFSFSREKAPIRIEPSPNKEYSAIVMTMSAER